MLGSRPYAVPMGRKDRVGRAQWQDKSSAHYPLNKQQQQRRQHQPMDAWWSESLGMACH